MLTWSNYLQAIIATIGTQLTLKLIKQFSTRQADR